MKIENEAIVVTKLAQRLDFLTERSNQVEGELEASVSGVKCSEDAQEVIQLLAQATQQQAHAKLSEVVSRCLTSVFEDPYQFQIVFERKAGKTEANLQFVRGDLVVDPLTASGGGVIDVAAFALRVACLMLSRPRVSRILILDEPFRFVSVQYQENVRVMLEELSEELEIQIIQVTHNENLVTGEVKTI